MCTTKSFTCTEKLHVCLNGQFHRVGDKLLLNDVNLCVQAYLCIIDCGISISVCQQWNTSIQYPQ